MKKRIGHKPGTQYQRRSGVSGFKGVCWNSHTLMWQARIGIGGLRKSIGYFKDRLDAALAYDRAAKELLGDKAILNFPNGYRPPQVLTDFLPLGVITINEREAKNIG